MNIPSKLKSNSIHQFEMVFRQLGLNQSILISLANEIQDGHISTNRLINSVNNLNVVDCTIAEIKDIDGKNKSFGWVIINEDGDSFFVVDVDRSSFIVQHIDEDGLLSKKTTINRKTAKNKLGRRLHALKILSLAQDKEYSGPENRNFVVRLFHTQLASSSQLIFVSIILTVLGLATPLGFQTITDKVLPYSASGSLLTITTLLILATIAAVILKAAHDYLENVLLGRYKMKLGKEVFSRLLKMEIVYFDQRNVGDLTKLVDQVDQAADFLVSQLLGSIVSALSLVVVLPVLFLYNSDLAVAVLTIGVTMSITAALFLKSLNRLIKESYLYDVGFRTSTIEILKGMKTIKALSNESFFLTRSNHSLENNLMGEFHVGKLLILVRSLLGLQSKLISIVVIFIGAHAVFSDTMTIGQLIAFNMLASNIVDPLLSLVMTASGWENFKLARAKLEELQPEVPPRVDAFSKAVNFDGEIEFKNVWFRYPNSSQDDDAENQYVLKNVSFKINKSEIIGVVGGSGSGKSTLVNLLLGFYKPSKGTILINGYDIALVPQEILRERISSVQQTSFLFNTSISENIHLGRLNASQSEIDSALYASGSQEFVAAMPHKHFTLLSEDGGNLSGGQRQRLAIARALVRESDILLFDEATSALDNQTEEIIKETIYEACQNKTGIIIAHRLNTLSYCNRLIVITNGEVEAIGEHKELLTTSPSYSAMWSATRKRRDIAHSLVVDADPI